ncbi:MAG: STAS/SEC14 domain-containing protein, partial [Chloroflexota bacterium]
KLRGVLIHSKAFPGWEDFGGFTAHLRFVREHHEKVARVAIATDSPLAGILESLGKHFISAEVKHFPYMDKAKALDWLRAAKGLGVPS